MSQYERSTGIEKGSKTEESDGLFNTSKELQQLKTMYYLNCKDFFMLKEKAALTGFDVVDFGFGAHVVGSIAGGADVRGDLDGHHAVYGVLMCLVHNLLPALWRHNVKR